MTLRGLYAITSEALCREPSALGPAVRAAVRGGAVLVQYRDKWNPPAVRQRLARDLAGVCRAAGARLIVNDDPALAAHAGADGVHLGAGDADVAAARSLLGAGAIVGVTCGDSIRRAQAAQAAGAAYVSFGRFFESRTKPGAPPASPAVLEQARAAIQVPVCVIGGLTPDNAAPLVAAGASLVAAVGGVFDAPDIESAARRYAQLFAPR